MKEYLRIIFLGITATFLYNYFANLLRAIGNSVVPLLFLAVSAVLNVILDLVCVLVWHWACGGRGSHHLLAVRVRHRHRTVHPEKVPAALPEKRGLPVGQTEPCHHPEPFGDDQRAAVHHEFRHPHGTGAGQQLRHRDHGGFCGGSQDRLLCYMPVQDFGNAFSTYVAQNYGAGQTDRIRKGIRSAGLCSAAFCIVISVLVCAFAAPLMGIFIDPAETAILLPVCTICTLRARAISASAFCSCSTATTGPSISPRCRWCSRSHLSAPVWRWPTCCRRPRWASPASGSVCPSAGHWPMPSALVLPQKAPGKVRGAGLRQTKSGCIPWREASAFL